MVVVLGGVLISLPPMEMVLCTWRMSEATSGEQSLAPTADFPCWDVKERKENVVVRQDEQGEIQ